jgi:hypothetical protein
VAAFLLRSDACCSPPHVPSATEWAHGAEPI